MRLVDNGGIRKLVPERGCKLYSQSANEYYDIVYLGIYDSPSNYTEVLAETLTEPLDYIILSDEINNIINE